MKDHSLKHKWLELTISIRVGFFLALRELKNANRWSTGLIIFIMTLTFLNMIVVRGILVGLPTGVTQDIREHYIGDLFISSLEQNTTIENSPQVIGLLEHLPDIQAISARYRTNGLVEANYQTQTNSNDEPNTAGGIVFGINPAAENATNAIEDFLFEGQFLEPGDYDQVLIGADLIRKYSIVEEGLDNISPGVKVRLTVNGVTREVTVKGILKSKVDTIGNAVYLIDEQLRQMLDRTDYGVEEISIRLVESNQEQRVKNILLANGIGKLAKVETYDESEPVFVQEITNTFSLLANIISSISLVVAAITTFIIIFVNAITQRQLIGIMKGIGIHWVAIVSSYVMLAWFYALMGILFGVVLIFGFLEPYILQHPIDFPFSDGILLVTWTGTVYRAALLLISTSVAGFIPAKMIVNKNTLDSILGR